MTKLLRKWVFALVGLLAIAIAPGAYAQATDPSGQTAASPIVAPALPTNANVDLVFTPVTPCRLCDTRVGVGDAGACAKGILAAGSRDVTVAGLCGVPAGATAATINITVVPAGGGAGDLRVAPNPPGTLPSASIINYQNSEVVANSTNVPIGTGVRLFVDGQSTDFIVDVMGYNAAVAAEACWNLSPFSDNVRCTLPAPLTGAALSASAMIETHCSDRVSGVYQVLGGGLLRQSVLSASAIQLSFVGSQTTASSGFFGGNAICSFQAELATPGLSGPFTLECPGGEGVAKFTNSGTLVPIACGASTTAEPATAGRRAGD
jgi:hypothetical protein